MGRDLAATFAGLASPDESVTLPKWDSLARVRKPSTYGNHRIDRTLNLKKAFHQLRRVLLSNHNVPIETLNWLNQPS